MRKKNSQQKLIELYHNDVELRALMDTLNNIHMQYGKWTIKGFGDLELVFDDETQLIIDQTLMRIELINKTRYKELFK